MISRVYSKFKGIDPIVSLTKMFKKPLAHQSNATPLRSSARRQLLASITAQYPLLVPSGDENEGQSGKEVGKLVLPEGVRTSTFETSAGVEGVSLLFFIRNEGES
jgi:translation initiation factor 2D